MGGTTVVLASLPWFVVEEASIISATIKTEDFVSFSNFHFTTPKKMSSTPTERVTKVVIEKEVHSQRNASQRIVLR